MDSAKYPERNGDGIARKIEGGVGYGYIFERAEDYMAPVTAHYGCNNVEQYGGDPANPSALIGGCTFEDRSRSSTSTSWIGGQRKRPSGQGKEVSGRRGHQARGGVVRRRHHPVDHVYPRREACGRGGGAGDRQAAGSDHPEVISKEVLQEAEGTRIEMKGKLTFDVDPTKLEVPPEPHHLSDAVLYKEFEEHPMVVVCGTVGEDEHSVGLREIINIKHGGIEKWGVKVHYLGTSVPVEKLVDAAVELNANAILASTIISHDNVHYKNMKRINELAVEKGIRDRVIIAAGGTQVIPDEAVKTGIDQGFGEFPWDRRGHLPGRGGHAPER